MMKINIRQLNWLYGKTDIPLPVGQYVYTVFLLSTRIDKR